MNRNSLIKIILALGLCVVLFLTMSILKFENSQSKQVNKYVNEAERHLPIGDSVKMADLTWLEIRDLIRTGYKTVVVPTGGIEQNGPFVITGKHDKIVEYSAELIAKELGKTLVSPTVSFVPQDDLKTPNGHLLYPGTISISDTTFESLIHEIVKSLKLSGFEQVVLLGDSGGNQAGLKRVAAKHNSESRSDEFRVIHSLKYYEEDKWSREKLKEMGVEQVFEHSSSGVPIHSDYFYEAMLIYLNPEYVRFESRVESELAQVNNTPLKPLSETMKIGKELFNHRTNIAIEDIRDQLKD